MQRVEAMRADLALAALSMLCATAALADALPAGWTSREDGAFVHQASGAACPAELGGLERTALEAKGAPDLGVCSYAGEQDREGQIRAREYVPGAGETPLAIQNDKTLMEPPSGDRKPMSAIRVGPGPDRNGAPTQQNVITLTRNGLLIDCIGRQPQSDTSKVAFDFALACLKQQRI
jgi:hypothetical protein